MTPGHVASYVLIQYKVRCGLTLIHVLVTYGHNRKFIHPEKWVHTKLEGQGV